MQLPVCLDGTTMNWNGIDTTWTNEHRQRTQHKPKSMELLTAGTSVPIDRGIGDLVGGDVTRIFLCGGSVHCARRFGRTEPPYHGLGELDNRATVDSGTCSPLYGVLSCFDRLGFNGAYGRDHPPPPASGVFPALAVLIADGRMLGGTSVCGPTVGTTATCCICFLCPALPLLKHHVADAVLFSVCRRMRYICPPAFEGMRRFRSSLATMHDFHRRCFGR